MFWGAIVSVKPSSSSFVRGLLADPASPQVKISINLTALFITIRNWKKQKKMPNVGKKSLLRKMFKRHYVCSNQKLGSTQSIGSAFLEKALKVQNSKNELDLKNNWMLFWWLWICKWSSCQFFFEKLKNNFDNSSIFFHMLRKLPKKTQNCRKNLQNFLQTCKKDVKFLLILKTVQKKRFKIFNKLKNWFNFFDRMQKLFLFFDKMLKVLQFNWQKASFFDTIWKVLHFFWQNAKTVSIFWQYFKSFTVYFLTKCKTMFHFFWQNAKKFQFFWH